VLRAILGVVALSLSLATASAWQLSQPAQVVEEMAPKRASLSGILQYDYRTLNDLVSAAPVIVVAKAESARTVQSGRLPFTETTTVVRDVLKGSVRAGELIRVLETGGLYTPIARDGSRPGLPDQEVDFESVPVMREGASYLLFLRPYLGDVVQGGFAVLGVYQGKMEVTADGRVAFAGAADKLAQPTFAVLRYMDGRRLEDVVREVRASFGR
jgi:hypothetical protein